MRCFVITPFDAAFDDVYATIRSHVEAAGKDLEITCNRLDEVRPAGRITDRLLEALRECSFCVADLTGCNPNVMWETGYAMALGKPVILVTQDIATLPFDIRDMQAIPYDRTKLHASLGQPLRYVVRDTIPLATVTPTMSRAEDEEHARAVLGLGVQLSEIKEMVGQMVAAWKTPQRLATRAGRVAEFEALKGSWLNEDSGSHVHVEIIHGVVVAPYCYGGDDVLTAYYYDWQQMGDYMFARFKWIIQPIQGFTFLKTTSVDTLQGAWWYDDKIALVPDRPLEGSGQPVIWRRTGVAQPPKWASYFFARVREGKIPDFRSIPALPE